MTSTQSIDTAEHDLLPHLIPYLDRHLVFPLLEFLDREEDEEEDESQASANNNNSDNNELIRAKFELLRHTNMTDFVGELHSKLDTLPQATPSGAETEQKSSASKDRSAEYSRRREEVLKQLDQFRQDTSALIGLLQDADVVSNLRSDKVANLNYLRDQHGVTVDMVDKLNEFGQFQYSCGDYGSAAELLYQFRILSTDNDKVTSATWGKLASEILTLNWESAMEEIQKLKENIDTRLFNNPLAQLQHRTWLIHWALFPFFNHEPARDVLTELFFSPAYINTIQTACPWILRYLTVAVVTGRSRSRVSSQHQKQLKDLVKVVRQEAYEYSDALTDFVKALYVDFDFEEAQKKLAQAENVLSGDFFLREAADAFVDAARHLISESYCKIHQRIDIKDLSTRLGLSQDEGEKWIVNLIRDTRVDAKIDYKDGTVLMNHPPQSVYQQVIERTKGGFFRTQVLSAAVAR